MMCLVTDEADDQGCMRGSDHSSRRAASAGSYAVATPDRCYVQAASAQAAIGRPWRWRRPGRDQVEGGGDDGDVGVNCAGRQVDTLRRRA
jgi:hypothetical protein